MPHRDQKEAGRIAIGINIIATMAASSTSLLASGTLPPLAVQSASEAAALDPSLVVKVIEALRLDIGNLHNFTKGITDGYEGDIDKVKQQVQNEAENIERILVDHDREVNTLKNEMSLVQSRLEGAINQIKKKVGEMEVTAASVESGKASKGDTTVEITKAMSALED